VQLLVARFIKWSSWLLVTLFVFSAIVITSLRVALPHLNYFQKEITQWVSLQSGLHISVSSVSGYWSSFHPYISLNNLRVNLTDGEKVSFVADKVNLELDLFRTLIQKQFIVSKLEIKKLNLDASSLNILKYSKEKKRVVSTLDSPQKKDSALLRVLDNLFLRQLDRIVILDSKIHYRSFIGEKRTLVIDHLKWLNKDRQHYAEGNVSIADTGLNSLKVRANFTDNKSFKDINGEFYLDAKNIALGPWLTRYLKKKIGITSGELSFDGWVTLRHSQPQKGIISLQPSFFRWGKNNHHTLNINHGIFQIFPTKNGLRISGNKFTIHTDDKSWPKFAINMDWQKGRRVLFNLNQMDLVTLLPFSDLIPDLNDDKDNWLLSLNPSGRLSDVRLSFVSSEHFTYSAKLRRGGLHHWSLLPEVHHLSANIYGREDQSVIQANLTDDILPYGDVFQAPLNIKRGYSNLVWQKNDQGWSLWSDKITVETPDLQAKGAFKLDFSTGKSPFLSFYSEVNLFNAGEAWRYLPTRALGHNLTDYLSSAIQAGETKTAKLIWYGDLHSFPYKHHNGVFQAWVPLQKAKFSYDQHWPVLHDLNIDLLFENDALFFDSDSAKLMNVNATKITGQIAHLNSDGVLNIDAQVSGQGTDVRNYMMATPLVDSVGAALTAVQIKGLVSSQFKLSIPLTSDKQPKAWGWAALKNNRVSMSSLSLDLTHVSGKVRFNNDIIKAAGIHADLLNQGISLDFNGESVKDGYDVHIDSIGNWKVKPLANYLDKQWVTPLNGFTPWQLGVDVQLTDVGFNYQAVLNAKLKEISSHYPYPLNKVIGQTSNANVQLSGNSESISARIELPDVKYQALIDVQSRIPMITASNLVLGRGSYKVTPFKGNYLAVRLDKFNLDHWISFLEEKKAPSQVKVHVHKAMSHSFPEIPVPEHVILNVNELTLASLHWHDVIFNAKKKAFGWRFDLTSQEAKGIASYIDPYDLSVSLKQLHLYLPDLDKIDDEKPIIVNRKEDPSQITSFERKFYKLVPNITLVIDDFWLQGYKVGKLNMDFQRQSNQLRWKKIDIVSGRNEVHANGSWTLNGNDSHTHLDMIFKGDNNSEILERFGISSGIQKAPFLITSSLDWKGAPWAMRIKTLQGKVKTKFGQGSVSDVNGAAKLLGLFSLDSIIRKMKLDFSDIFDKGLAFDSIKGDGDISHGSFITNNLTVDTVAGDMDIKGLVDLDKRTIDAEVKFIPDVTSGIPVLSAFAVSPPTALYVFAITTVISPVVEIFTEVNYQVKGPIDAPEVKEISRSKGEYKLPSSFMKKTGKEDN